MLQGCYSAEVFRYLSLLAAAAKFRLRMRVLAIFFCTSRTTNPSFRIQLNAKISYYYFLKLNISQNSCFFENFVEEGIGNT